RVECRLEVVGDESRVERWLPQGMARDLVHANAGPTDRLDDGAIVDPVVVLLPPFPAAQVMGDGLLVPRRGVADLEVVVARIELGDPHFDARVGPQAFKDCQRRARLSDGVRVPDRTGPAL